MKAKASAKRFEQLLKKQNADTAADLGIDFATNSDADDVEYSPESAAAAAEMDPAAAPDVETAMDASADPLEAGADDPDADFDGDEPAASAPRATRSSAAAAAADADASLGLSPEDLRHLEAMAADSEGGGPRGPIEEEEIDEQRFVKFRDALPPPPRRGRFNVENVEKSAYFFS